MPEKTMIMKQWNLPGDIACLTLSRNIPKETYYKYRIGEKTFEPISVYDMDKNIIAIKTKTNLIGQTVEFI